MECASENVRSLGPNWRAFCDAFCSRGCAEGCEGRREVRKMFFVGYKYVISIAKNTSSSKKTLISSGHVVVENVFPNDLRLGFRRSFGCSM